MADTTYKVHLLYDMQGNAQAGMKGLRQETQRATSGFGGLRSAMALAFGGGALALGKKAFYDYNVQMDRLKLGMGTVVAMNLGKPFAEGKAASAAMFTSFQQFAKVSVGTTADYAQMANSISGAVLASGKGMKDLEEMAKGAVVAEHALGAPSGMLALDITQMLAGTVAIRDRFARQLLRTVGQADYLAFNKLDAGKRADLVKKSLTSDVLKAAAKEAGESTEGVMSTLKDNLQIELAKAAEPLIKMMTKTIKEWNDWIGANGDKIAQWSKTVGDTLVTGFGMMKDAVGFLVEHADTILLIGKVWLAAKAGGMLASGAQMLAAGGGAVAGAFTNSLSLGSAAAATATTAGRSGTAGLIGGAPAVAAAGFVGWQIGRELDKATGLGDMIMSAPAKWLGVWSDAAERADTKNKAVEKSLSDLDAAIKRQADIHRGAKPDTAWSKATGAKGTTNYAGIMGAVDVKMAEAEKLKDSLRGLNQARASGHMSISPRMNSWLDSQNAKNAGQYNRIGELQARAAMSAKETDSALMWATKDLTNAQLATVNMEKVTQRVMEEMIRSYDQAGGAIPLWRVKEILGGEMDSSLVDSVKPPPVNVNIGKVVVEVASDDPDRFVHGAVRAFGEVVRNPVAAADTIRGGF